MKSHPKLSSLIEQFKLVYSSSLSNLNDTSSEYVVQTIKHFFDGIIIVQYVITNTLEDQVLSKVRLVVSNIDSNYNLKLHSVVSLAADENIKYSDRRSVYAIFSKEECDTPFPTAKVS
jgi:coatomer protein complex subunit gamma